MDTTTYTEARGSLARLWDRAVHDREIIRVTRRGTEDIAIIAADELESLLETAYLLRSPANAERLNAALHSALARNEQPTTVEDLRRELGIEREDGEGPPNEPNGLQSGSGRSFPVRVPRRSRVAGRKGSKTRPSDA